MKLKPEKVTVSTSPGEISLFRHQMGRLQVAYQANTSRNKSVLSSELRIDCFREESLSQKNFNESIQPWLLWVKKQDCLALYSGYGMANRQRAVCQIPIKTFTNHKLQNTSNISLNLNFITMGRPSDLSSPRVCLQPIWKQDGTEQRTAYVVQLQQKRTYC